MLLLSLLYSAGVSSARADWPAGGLRLATGVAPGNMAACPDGSGGAIVFAPEEFSTASPHHVFARVTWDGSIPQGWPSSAIEPAPGLVFHEFRGFAVGPSGNAMYVDQISPTTMRVRRLGMDGGLDPRWPAGGQIIESPSQLDFRHVGGGLGEPEGWSSAAIGDGAGGLFQAWCTTVDEPSLHVTRVLEDGSFAPGWDRQGQTLPLPHVRGHFGTTLAPLTYSEGVLVVSGSNWYWTEYSDYPNFPSNADPFTVMLGADGGLLGAVAPASDATASTTSATSAVQLQTLPDGQGGEFKFWLEHGATYSSGYVLLRGQHLGADGTPAPGWPAIGAKTIYMSNPGIVRFDALSNARGGALLVWQDFKNTTGGNPDVVALGIDGAGQPTTDVGLRSGARALRLVAGPVPARAAVSLSLSLATRGHGAIAVFDVNGRQIRKLFDGELDRGDHAFRWDGMDASGRPSSPGVYLARATFGDRAVDARIVRLR